MDFKSYGIEIGFLVSGLLGAILMISKNATQNLKASILSVVGGMASANYLTPVMVHLVNIKGDKLQNGFAFITGFLGLKLVEIVSQKFLNKIEEVPIPKKVVKKAVAKKTIKTKK
jgi:hypothetical protein